MKVLEKHTDGSQTILFETGDRVRIKKDHFIGPWKVDVKGDGGTVVGTDVRADTKHPSIAFVYFQSDRAKATGWGSTHVAPWYLEME